VGTLYEARVEQILKKLTVAQDPFLVDNLSREFLAERPAELLAEMISLLAHRMENDRMRIVYQGVVRVALSGKELPQRVREEVYSILASRDEGHWAQFLLPVAGQRVRSQSKMPDPVVEDMTLGMKKWKARLQDHNLLQRLGREDDPAVMAILLDNPRLLELDVVTWSARRPASPAVLLVIATHRKWGVRRAVQEAIVRNPYTPVHVATAFLPLFDAGLLRLVASEPSLHDTVRSTAKRIIEARKMR